MSRSLPASPDGTSTQLRPPLLAVGEPVQLDVGVHEGSIAGAPIRPLTDVVSIRTLADALEAMPIVEAAEADGRLVPLAKWSPAQNFMHCGVLLSGALDGFTFRLPLFLRAVGRATRGATLGPKPMPRGIKHRGGLEPLAPASSVDFTSGLEALRTPLSRIVLSGQSMTHPNPLYGSLGHDQWMTFQVKHVRHHFQFVGIRGA